MKIKVQNEFKSVGNHSLFSVYTKKWLFWKRVGFTWALDTDEALRKVAAMVTGKEKGGN